MSGITVPQVTQTPSSPPSGRPKKRWTKEKVRSGIIAIIVLAALAVGGYFLYRFLTKHAATQSEMQLATAEIGTIQSKASGSGNAKAKETAAITLSAGGTVQDVFVAPGDVVTAGQPLYNIYSATAQEEARTAQERLDTLNKDMVALQEDASNLTVRAPFSGKLINVKTFSPDQDVSKDAPVATLVNDK